MIQGTPLSLTLVGVQLDGTKLNKALIDQIPVQGIYKQIELPHTAGGDPVWNDDEFTPLEVDIDTVRPVCRFHALVLIESMTRRYKARGYDRDQTNRLIYSYKDLKECALFEGQGRLFFDFFTLGEWAEPKRYEINSQKRNTLADRLKAIAHYQEKYAGKYEVATFFEEKTSATIQTLTDARIDYYRPPLGSVNMLRRKKSKPEYVTLTQDLLDTLIPKMQDEQQHLTEVHDTLNEQLKAYHDAMSELNRRIASTPMAMLGV